MTKRNEIYKCSESKNLFEVITPSNEAVCGLERVVENTTEAATEKHIPSRENRRWLSCNSGISGAPNDGNSLY